MNENVRPRVFFHKVYSQTKLQWLGASWKLKELDLIFTKDCENTYVFGTSIPDLTISQMLSQNCCRKNTVRTWLLWIDHPVDMFSCKLREYGVCATVQKYGRECDSPTCWRKGRVESIRGERAGAIFAVRHFVGSETIWINTEGLVRQPGAVSGPF